MSANISRNQDGKYEMAYFGEKPWHGLGTEVEGLMTAEQALEAASLDWNVVKHPVYANINGVFVPVENQFATVRMDSGKPLGIVGSRYRPVQNRDALNLLDSIVGTGEAHYETVGALGNGERVWLLARVSEKMNIVGEEHAQYIFLANSHDGKLPLLAQFTDTRIVCQNTLAIALRDGRKQWRARHTPDIVNKVEEARKILGFAHDYFSALKENAEKLVKVHPSDVQITNFFGALYKVDTDTVKAILANGKVPKGELERHVQYTYDCYKEGLGNDNPSVKNTAYALIQGVTDYLDHGVTLRKGNTQEQRFEKAFFGQNANLKQEAWDMALALCN